MTLHSAKQYRSMQKKLYKNDKRSRMLMFALFWVNKAERGCDSSGYREASLLWWRSTWAPWVSWRLSSLNHTRPKWLKCLKVDQGLFPPFFSLKNSHSTEYTLMLSLDSNAPPTTTKRQNWGRGRVCVCERARVRVKKPLMWFTVCGCSQEMQPSRCAAVWRWRLWRTCYREKVSSHTTQRGSSSSSTMGSLLLDRPTARRARSPCSSR